jgi:hypothetical protein
MQTDAKTMDVFGLRVARVELFHSSFLELSDSIPCLLGRMETLYFLFGCEMIITPFDTVKRPAHMSVSHSSGAHMVHERERRDLTDFLEPLGPTYQGNISPWERLRCNKFFNQTKKMKDHYVLYDSPPEPNTPYVSASTDGCCIQQQRSYLPPKRHFCSSWLQVNSVRTYRVRMVIRYVLL